MADEYPKTAGDYAVEIETAIANNNATLAQPVIAEMKASLPAPDPNAAPVEPPAAPPPVDQGIAIYADKLQAAADSNNVVEMRALCEEMKTVAPPTPPPPEPAPAP